MTYVGIFSPSPCAAVALPEGSQAGGWEALSGVQSVVSSSLVPCIQYIPSPALWSDPSLLLHFLEFPAVL